MDVPLTVVAVACVALGAGAGAVAARGAARRREEALRRHLEDAATGRAAAESALGERGERLRRAEADLAASEEVTDRLRAALSEAEQARARLEAEQAALREFAESRAALLDQAEARLKEAFGALAGEALRTNSEALMHLAREKLGDLALGARSDLEARERAIGELLKPVESSLRDVDAKLREIEKERAGAYAALMEQIRSMAQTQQRLQSETTNLVGALRAPQVRGRWGEIQLRRVVEMAGMLDHCDFVEQESVATEQGRLRPDLLVRLPGGKTVVVDAKAPLAAYLEALEASDEATREAKLREHARRVRDHMTRLGAKTYWDQFASAPDFVVMFLPGESFFSAALQHDPGLIDYGVPRYVIPSSPTTLIALLRAVHYGWKQERVAANAARIRDLGAELHDRLRVMAEHLDRVRRGLEAAVEGYNAVVGSVESRVLVSARRLREMGASTGDEILELRPMEARTRTLPVAEPERDALTPGAAAEEKGSGA